MFGSKLRSWMENHIVRPRKKANKNKNPNGHEGYKKNTAATGYTIYHSNGTTTTPSTTTGGAGAGVGTAAVTTSSSAASTSITHQAAGNYGSTSASGSGSGSCATANHNGAGGGVIASPVRRREVSPIQSHTHSRYGWQSPEHEHIVTSPKSDNFLYAPQHHRVRSQQQHHQPHQHQHHHQQQHHHYHHSTAPNSKDSSSADKYVPKQPATLLHQPQPDCSSSSISSLSWSTGSKEPSSMHSSGGGPGAGAGTGVAANQLNKSSHSADVSSFEPVCHSAASTASFHNSEQRHLDEDKNEVHYEEIRTLLRHPDNIYNNNFMEPDRPKSEQLVSFATRRSFSGDNTQDDASTRYGRLLPSRIQTHSSGSIDSLNGNNLRVGSAECIPTNYNRSSIAPTSNYVCPGQVMGLPNPSTAPLNNTQRSRLRTSRFGGPVLNPTQASITAGPMHSLSSPESAYSTGYSTDGTSPGAIYTPPEYYINMRTGTHYFPKSVNSLAIEAQRYKFGLNKIEEMSPIDPLPKTSFENTVGNPADKVPSFFITGELSHLSNGHMELPRPLPHDVSSGCRSPVALRNTIVLPTLQGFESPSPRQRCRIRTNPWYSTADTLPLAANGTTPQQQQQQQPYMAATSASSTISSSASSKSICSSTVMRMELDAASLSSAGIKSSNDAEVSSDRNKHNGKSTYNSESESSSSSLTEVENMQRTYSPNTIRRRRVELMQPMSEPVAGTMLYPQCAIDGGAAGAGAGGGGGGCGDGDGGGLVECHDALVSDDDATLNEMMGKFDESYVYEKETDILSSDSDPTDCPSVDTGQDAEDECDTDELLDIDFIDTSSIQEVNDRRDTVSNLGSCSYYSNSPTRSLHQHVEVKVSLRSRRTSRSLRAPPERNSGAGGPSVSGGSQRRRKRFMKTRKKSAENRGDRQFSPRPHSRESRSVGGTPVCLRRNLTVTKESIYKTSPLSNRSSSLVFTDVRESRFMTIAESEKALLRADMEADVKYRQLILEAESILVSLRNSTQSIPRETPVASPRRVNPLANKRVEMLRNCDGEPKRQQQQQQQRAQDLAASNAEQELAAAINKRIELLKYESASAPNSPKSSRCSLRKTHLTNFINQNVPPDVPPRKQGGNTGSGSGDYAKPSMSPSSPQLQLNGRRMQSANSSPLARRRFRSQSPKLTAANSLCADSDSDTEYSLTKHASSGSLARLQHGARHTSQRRSKEDIANRNYLPEIAKIVLYDEQDYDNRNVALATDPRAGSGAGHKPSTLMPFKSVAVAGGGSAMGDYYCPQSEPLKRKVYKGSSTFERIKKSLDMDSEIPKQRMLAKINNLRLRDRHQVGMAAGSGAKLSPAKSSSRDLNPSSQHNDNDDDNSAASSKKQLMLLSTIADLKRSLETQSVELNGLNDD